ncbi:hypothetical protein WJX82_001439 [Trebouxia sp. C0006]
MQLGRYAVLDSTDPELSIRRITPNSWPDTASWRRINSPQRPHRLQPKQWLETGQALRPILEEVEHGMNMAAGTLGKPKLSLGHTDYKFPDA